jgi:hypothetical protein
MRKGKRIVMVATSAFGLGIDKPDIRYIIHYQAPASLERYLQEAGRAGRDGHPARCVLLFDESDLEIQEHLLALSRLSPSLLWRFGRALAAYAGEDRDANIEELALSADISQRAATSLVTVLVEAGICERVDGGRVHPLVPTDDLVKRVASLRDRFEILRREDGRRMKAVVDYVNEETCRSGALRRYFGDTDPAPCGRCDLCRAHGVVAPGRGFGRRRRHRDRRREGPPLAARGPADGPGAPRAASPAPFPARRFDGFERRRRRRRRGRGGDRFGRPSGPPTVAAAPGPSIPPPPVIPPLDAAADDLAAELGAPSLPAPPPSANQAAPSAPRPPHHRRRRRRRRRGHGPGPSAPPPPGAV